MTAIRTWDSRNGPVRATTPSSRSRSRREVFDFLGPNGAGKTTTIDQLLDFVRPSEGDDRLRLESHRIVVPIAIGYRRFERADLN